MDIASRTAALGAALLGNNFRMILVWYPAVVIVPIIQEFLYIGSPESHLLLRLLTRILELSFFYAIGSRALAQLRQKHESASPSPLTLPCFLLAGTLHWSLSEIGLLLSPQLDGLIGLSAAARFLVVVLGFVLWYLLFYFYWPVLRGVRDPRRIAAEALTLLRRGPLLPFFILFGPFMVQTLVGAIISLPFPDGRDAFLSCLYAASSGIAWTLSTCGALAAAMVQMSDREWLEGGFDSYRENRFATLEKQAPPLLTACLHPRRVLPAALGAFLVVGAQWLRFPTLAPSPKIQFQSAHADGSRLEIAATISDPSHALRGFRPIFFRLAGTKGTTVAQHPQSAYLKGHEPDVRFWLPLSRDEHVLTLEFSTDRPAREILQLQDLFLWYGGVKVFQVPQQELPDQAANEPTGVDSADSL